MKDKIVILGILGIIASVAVGIGEYLLHVSPYVLSAGKNFEFFKYVPLENLRQGHFWAVFGLLLYFPGYFHVYYMLQPGNKTMAVSVLFLGISAFAVGAIWIGSRAFIGTIVHMQIEIPNEAYLKIIGNYNGLLEVLVKVLRIIIVALSTVFIITIAKGETWYKKWMAFFSPIVILFVLVLTLKIPAVGRHIVPILMNVTHFIFFGLSLFNYYLYTKNK